MYVMLEQYHFLKCEEQFFSSNIINSPYRGLKNGSGKWNVSDLCTEYRVYISSEVHVIPVCNKRL